MFDRFRPWRLRAEVGFWLLVFVLNGVGNSITVAMDARREGASVQPWEPWLWECSSGVVWLALIPAIVWLGHRLPLRAGTLLRRLPVYLLASVVVSVVHVAAMGALRLAVYRVAGVHYDFFNDPGWRFGYEYLKDVRTFAWVVVLIEAYRFVILRLQGEVHLLAAPDEGPPVEPIERPERFLVRKLGRDFLIAASDIEWIQAAGNYVNLHVRGRDYPLRATMAGIESRLDPARFVRIHRSYIVNLGRIVSIEPLDGGEGRVHLGQGEPLPCSRRYLSGLRERVGGGEVVETADAG